jgi:hypothetical protein
VKHWIVQQSATPSAGWLHSQNFFSLWELVWNAQQPKGERMLDPVISEQPPYEQSALGVPQLPVQPVAHTAYALAANNEAHSASTSPSFDVGRPLAAKLIFFSPYLVCGSATCP